MSVEVYLYSICTHGQPIARTHQVFIQGQVIDDRRTGQVGGTERCAWSTQARDCQTQTKRETTREDWFVFGCRRTFHSIELLSGILRRNALQLTESSSLRTHSICHCGENVEKLRRKFPVLASRSPNLLAPERCVESGLGVDRRKGRRVPEPHRPVRTGGSKRLPVGGKRHVRNLARVSAKRGDLLRHPKAP